MKILGQECIDAIGITPETGSNIVIIASSPLETTVVVAFQEVDRFGARFTKKTYSCNYDKALKRIVSLEK